MRYLFDANVFIEAKNRYYAFDICPGFWDWMDTVVESDSATITMVRDELRQGTDDLSSWIAARHDRAWFLSVDDESTQGAFVEVLEYVTGAHFRSPAVEKFLNGADPWLIAKASVLGASVVTHEAYDRQARKKVPIPNICLEIGVPVLNTFDLLRTKSVQFGLR